MREIATLPPWGNDIFFLSDCLILQKQDCTDRYTLFRQKKRQSRHLTNKTFEFHSYIWSTKCRKTLLKIKVGFCTPNFKIAVPKTFCWF